jgi:hypothetical protein
VAVSAVVAACGSGGGQTGSGDERPARTALRVTVWPHGQRAGDARTGHIVCPGSRSGCAAVSGLDPAALAPTPPRTACAARFGGPAQARVEGVLNGRRVRASFGRTDSCAVRRWDRLHRLLALAGG